jgi:hypothetical protein
MENILFPMDYEKKNQNQNLILKKKVRIAIVGCLHGHLKDLYNDIKFQDEKEGKKTDLVLCCGDFQVSK